MNGDTWQRHALLNRLQTFVLLAIMVGFLALLGWLLWGQAGLLILLISGLLLTLFNPSVSPRLVMRLYRAEPLTVSQAPHLYEMLDELTRRCGLPTRPTLYYLPSEMVNAFAVGQAEHAGIALSDGLLHRLSMREINAVLAHEISHIRSNDMRVMGIADVFSRLTSMLSLFGQLLLLLNLPLLLLGAVTVDWLAVGLLIMAPTLSVLAQLGLSRTREFDADLNAAHLTGDPEALAQALTKIEAIQGGWVERIFLPGKGLPEPSVLRTHPPTEERIQRLRTLQLPREEAYAPLMIGSPRQILNEHFAPRKKSRSPRWRVSGLWH